MITNLTNLKWQKNFYYTSNDVIFEISSKKLIPNLDECETYLVDIELNEALKNAALGAMVDISSTPSVFTECVPYIHLSFDDGSGNFLEKYFPLQSYIEEGDMIVDGKAKQNHPAVYNNEYHVKFYNEVFDFIKQQAIKMTTFSENNVDTVYNKLPAFLTADPYECIMTESYINNNFLKGMKYDKKLATTKKTEDEPLYKFITAVIGIGTDPIEGTYVPVNIWNKETIYNVLQAIYAEQIISKYTKEVDYLNEDLMHITQDSMEDLAESIKNINLGGYKPMNIRTLPYIQFHDHDVDSIEFVSKCTNADTYYEYLKEKETKIIPNLEDVITSDKAWIENYITNNYTDPTKVSKFFYESCIVLNDYIDDGDASSDIYGVSDIFVLVEQLSDTTYNNALTALQTSLGTTQLTANQLKENLSASFDTLVIMITRVGDQQQISMKPHAWWAGDQDLWTKSADIVKTFEDAYTLMANSDKFKSHSTQCVLRIELGPNSINPQYVFGNQSGRIFVDAKDGTVRDSSPAFPDEP